MIRAHVHIYICSSYLWYQWHIYFNCNCATFLLFRPNHALPSKVNENEYADVESGARDMAMAALTENPSSMTPKEVVTSFTFNAEEDKVDHTYEVLPFEANVGGPENPTHGGQGDDIYCVPV